MPPKPFPLLDWSRFGTDFFSPSDASGSSDGLHPPPLPSQPNDFDSSELIDVIQFFRQHQVLDESVLVQAAAALKPQPLARLITLVLSSSGVDPTSVLVSIARALPQHEPLVSVLNETIRSLVRARSYRILASAAVPIIRAIEHFIIDASDIDLNPNTAQLVDVVCVLALGLQHDDQVCESAGQFLSRFLDAVFEFCAPLAQRPPYFVTSLRTLCCIMKLWPHLTDAEWVTPIIGMSADELRLRLPGFLMPSRDECVTICKNGAWSSNGSGGDDDSTQLHPVGSWVPQPALSSWKSMQLQVNRPVQGRRTHALLSNSMMPSALLNQHAYVPIDDVQIQFVRGDVIDHQQHLVLCRTSQPVRGKSVMWLAMSDVLWPSSDTLADGCLVLFVSFFLSLALCCVLFATTMNCLLPPPPLFNSLFGAANAARMARTICALS